MQARLADKAKAKAINKNNNPFLHPTLLLYIYLSKIKEWL